VLGHVTKTMR